MLGAAIIPEGNGVLRPLKTYLKFRALLMRIKHLQDSLTLRGSQAVDLRRKAWVHVKRLAQRTRMRPHNRVLGAGIDTSPQSDAAVAAFRRSFK